MIKIKPVFVPLKKEYYDDFKSGDKTEELRRYGPRWNERICQPCRDIILSCGYGKQSRMIGRISRFKKQYGTRFGLTYRKEIMAVFGTLNIEIACISITGLKPWKEN